MLIEEMFLIRTEGENTVLTLLSPKEERNEIGVCGEDD